MTRNSSADVAPVVVLLGIILAAANLRPAITSVPPVLEVIRADIGVSYAVVSLLTAIPVFCMGLFAFATPWVIAFVGRERGLFWGISLIGIATAARIASHHSSVLFVTTILVGVGIAISQTLLPPIVSTYFPGRIAFATGIYTASLATGATIASGTTVPLYAFLDSWPLALASWAILAVVALVALVPLYRHAPTRKRSRDNSVGSRSRGTSVSWRSVDIWVMLLVLGGCNTIFYSTMTWLAPRYLELGWSETGAGILLTVFLFAELPGMLAISAFADRFASYWIWFVVMLALVAIGAFGTAFAPLTTPFLWAVSTGIGIGGTFALSMTLPAEYIQGDFAAERVSSMVLGGGYVIGAIGPFVIGVLRDFGGGYPGVFASMIVVAFVMVLLTGLFERTH